MNSSWKSRSVGALATLVLIGTAGLALAQSVQPPVGGPPPPAPPNVIGEPEGGSRKGAGRAAMAACRADAQTLCSTVEAGRGARIKCLIENRAKASPECQGALQAIADRQQGGGERGKRGEGLGKRMAACQTDFATFCGGAPAEGGGRLKCLKQNEAKLSPECKATLQSASDTRQRLRQACATDRQALCSTARKGKETMQCLIGNEAKLSPDCKTVLAELPQGRVKKR